VRKGLSEASSGTCGKYLNWTLDEATGVMTISGNGEMTDECNLKSQELVKTLIIKDGVEGIYPQAFEGWEITSVTIGNSVTTIGLGAFSYCRHLTQVTFGNSVDFIGEDAFVSCDKLTNVVLPDSLTTIDTGAFQDCGFYSFTLPKSVKSVGSYFLAENKNLKAILVEYGNKYYDSVNGVLFSKDKTTLIGYPCDGPQDYVIPQTVTTIGEGAFCGSSVKTIVLPDSLQSIGDAAFGRCDNLYSVVIPDSVTSLGENAFFHCSSLVSVTLSNSITFIDFGTFLACLSLESIVIPDSVVSIDSYAFSLCKGLKSIQWGKSVKYIGYQAFKECTSLVSLTIPEPVQSIGESAFESLSSLETLNISASVTSIDNEAFKGCTHLKSVAYMGLSDPRAGDLIFVECPSSMKVCTAPGYSSPYFCDRVIDGVC